MNYDDHNDDEDRPEVPQSGSARESLAASTAGDRGGYVFIVVACITALIVGMISVGLLLSDPAKDKAVEASYESLAKKQTTESPFPAELKANFTRLKDRWGANGPVTDKDLAEFSKQHRIEAIQLNFSEVTDQGFSALENQPVQMIVISGSPITGKDMAALSKIPALRRVNIYESTVPITDDALSKLTGPPQIFELTLRKSALTERGIAYAAKTFKKLETLDLMYSQTVTDQVVDPILEIPRLLTVNLSFTKVTARGVEKLATKKSLINMHIAGIGITDSTIPHLLANGKLGQLNISESNVTDKALRLLAKAKSLKILVVGNCKLLTVRGLEEFRRARPDCNLIQGSKKPVEAAKD